MTQLMDRARAAAERPTRKELETKIERLRAALTEARHAAAQGDAPAVIVIAQRALKE